MRTLLAVLALALAGCDKLWEPYIVTYGSAGSAGEAFPSTLENSYRLSRQYMLMATGNYDGDADGVADVAVSGVFTSSDINANVANLVPVEIYTGDGQGGLKLDGSCLDAPLQRPVYLLTVPSPGRPGAQDILVATEDSNIYLCSKASGAWAATAVKTFGGVFNGFKRMALAYNDPPGSDPDLAIRIGINQFTDNSSTTGSLHVYRADGFLSFGRARIQLSPGNINWVLPYRPSGAQGDTLATTWDNAAVHPGVEFHSLAANNTDINQGSGQTGAADVPGVPFSELKKVPFAALAPLHQKDASADTEQNSLLFTYSQEKNSVAVLYGDTINSFSIQAQETELMPGGFMLPYAGDADGDKSDEIGLYTMAPSGNRLTRHLLLLSYKGGSIRLMNPIQDIANPAENFRAMALEYLGSASDARRQRKRKDLVALVEDPAGASSRLMVRRSDLSYQFP